MVKQLKKMFINKHYAMADKRIFKVKSRKRTNIVMA